MAIKIHQNKNFGTHNTSKRYGSISYIVIHYVGASGSAENNIKYLNQRSTTRASADFFVGHKGEIWQYNPVLKKRYCWAVGGCKYSTPGGAKYYGKAKNSNCVSIEMCVELKHGKWTITDKTLESTIELTKYLMKELHISESHVIRHFDVTGKDCPCVKGWIPPCGGTQEWNKFKKAISAPAKPEKKVYYVRKSWKNKESQIGGAYTSLKRATEVCNNAPKSYEVYNSKGEIAYMRPYKVEITAKTLNIREKPKKTSKVVGQLKKGERRIIIDRKGDWGFLKTQKGWIHLDYTKRID